ncbi:hypothetical protein I7096_005088 [Vibrio parahaemolyticus]|nr:hypothetical protein [Vibrio parahaemolyticus]
MAVLVISKHNITKRLRRIPNAWHFRFDSALVFTAQWFRYGGSVAHHLTRRYV